MLGVEVSKVRVMFITTAANNPDAIEVLPKCLNDLLKCGISRENIYVYDMHTILDIKLKERFDVVYICGGNTQYLLNRINEKGFRKQLLDYIDCEGFVLGVSAGSILFAQNLENNLGLLECNLDVHCSEDMCEHPGVIDKNKKGKIKLGNLQAMILSDREITIIEKN